MDGKRYYGERIGVIKQEKYDFKMLKRLFINIYTKLEAELYFQEATGYECTDENVVGLLGSDIEAEIYLRTGLKYVWPIWKYIDNYEEVDLFTMIEFLYDHVSAPKNKWYHSWNSCGWYDHLLTKKKGEQGFVKK